MDEDGETEQHGLEGRQSILRHQAETMLDISEDGDLVRFITAVGCIQNRR